MARPAKREGGSLSAMRLVIGTEILYSAASAAPTARMAPCPCGSGKQHKRCCGSLENEFLGVARTFDASPELQAIQLNRAIAHMHRGEGTKAEAVLKNLRADSVGTSEIALVAGEICIDLHRLMEAAVFLDRAFVLDPQNPEVASARAECRHLGERAEAWQRSGITLRAQLEDLDRRAQARQRQGARAEHVHLVCKLDTIGGTERRALNLYRCLSRHAPVTPWSITLNAAKATAGAPVRRMSAEAFPDGGTLVLVGTYFECGDWLESSAFERVVICHNLAEQHENLGQLLSRLQANASRPRVDLVFPSHFFRELGRLPGTVEYSPVDTEVFRPQRSQDDSRRKLIVGRHGRAYPYKFDPNDPAFFRRLLARGYDVSLLGGSVIAAAFAGEAATPDLLEVGALGAAEFLDSLDVFVYRKHPRYIETGGTVILEAMAMALPVVVFAQDCGCAEMIADGENGFLVRDETQADACIDRLRDDYALRARIGAAARATIVKLMRRQEADIVRFYLDRAAG